MTFQLDERLGTFQNRSFLVGGIALVASIVGAFFNTQQFFVSYLFSYLFWLGLAAGSSWVRST